MSIQTHNLTNREFKQYRTLVYQECGIHLTDDKRQLLNARISKRLRALGLDTRQYLKRIQENADELIQFVDAVSTNHTYFFRESRSFTYIDNNCERIWCAAASSGEEPYSLAAYCHAKGYSTSILATDISNNCLKKARTGVYPIERKSQIPLDILQAGFQKGRRRWDGYMRVKPEIRKKVRFRRFNLLKDRLPEERFDVIFCRNVMIYFDHPTKEQVIMKLSRALRPKGFFIIGGAESLNGLKHGLKYIEPSVYRIQ